ncbi:hypothetical protein BH18ACT15_BH18ACT15_09080 [soil metagenome]
MARRLSAAGWLLALVLLATACDSGGGDLGLRDPQPSPTGVDTRIVGLVGTMSGPDSWRGEDAYEGADLGAHTLSAGGKRAYELVTLDDRGDAARARRLIGRLAALPRVDGIVYAGPSGALEGAEAPLAEGGIPLLVCYGTVPYRSHIFPMAPGNGVQARRLVSYATRDRGDRALGLLAETGAEGSGVAASVRAAVAKRGGTRLVVARSRPGGPGLDEALSSLRAQGVEGLLVHAAPAGYTRALRALTASGGRYRSTAAARLASAPPGVRRAREASGWWHPQVLAFELAVDPRVEGEWPGLVAAASYDRGAFYLSLPAFRTWNEAFSDWWQKSPYGWQLRSYIAARLIGLAASDGSDGAHALEQVGRLRLGGWLIGLSRRDHEVASAAGVGLWVVPRPDLGLPDERWLPKSFPWVPLARGFAAGRRSRLPPAERPALFPTTDSKGPRPPLFTRQRWGVTSGRGDPLY